MSQYSKNLSGVNQKVIVGTPTYTAQTTFSSFISTALEGEVGVFLENGTRVTAALPVASRFFVAQKRDGNTNKTPILATDDIIRKTRTPFTAPTAKVVALGFHPVVAPTASYNLTFTGASNTDTLLFGLTARDLTPGNQPYPVQEGYTSVNATTAAAFTVLSDLVESFMGSLDYANSNPDIFTRAEILTGAAPTAPTAITAAATLSVTNKSTSVVFNAAPTGAPVVSQLLVIAGDTYRIESINGTTYILGRPYTGPSATLPIASVQAILNTASPTQLGVRLTGVSTDVIFNASATGNPTTQTTLVTTVTPWLLGSGAGNQIFELESTEGIVFDGVGSTRNVAFREDYGTPTLFASKTTNYDQVFVDLASRNIPSAVPTQYDQRQMQRILVAAPVGGTLSTTLATIFGV